MKVMGVCGLAGSGKSFVTEVAKNHGFIIYNMGDVIREEALKRNMSTNDVAVQLRKEKGNNIVAKIIVEKIKENKNQTFIIEGIRSLFEVEFFEKSFNNFEILSIFSSPKTRFNRLKMRNREDDNQTYEKFKERDERELNFGIANVIVNSNYLIINESGLEEYKKNLNNFFNNI
jgi:dephospho-CoA kinase